MNEKSMHKMVSRIPEKKRKEIADALKHCKTHEEAAAVIAKYATFIPKDKVKEIFDRLDHMKEIDYDGISKTADELIRSMKAKK